MSSDLNPTRDRILNAALSLLEAGGPVRMVDIAKAAGISRQAVYLHFPTRAELLVAATRHVDEVKNVDGVLAESRGTATGEARLVAYVAAWGNYIPEVYGVGKALMAMEDSDPEARAAWQGRMQAMREGCAAAVAALMRDGQMAPEMDEERATDLLWALLSVRMWEQLTIVSGWSQAAYIDEMTRLARRALVAP